MKIFVSYFYVFLLKERLGLCPFVWCIHAMGYTGEGGVATVDCAIVGDFGI